MKVQKPKMTAKKEELFKDLQTKTKQVNRRLLNIEKYTGDTTKASWAGAFLEKKLDTKMLNAMSEKHRVKISPNMTISQMRAVEAELDKFLNRSTSKIRGIKKAEQSSINAIKKMYTTDNNLVYKGKESLDQIRAKEIEFTKEDAAKIYEIFEDENVRDFVDQMGGSDILIFIKESIEKNDFPKSFSNKLSKLLDAENDVQFREKATQIYNKYVKPFKHYYK